MVKNSHAVTRRLTKAWEFSDAKFKKHLWYYDFRANEFGHMSSKRLLTSAVSYGDDVECFLNRIIETPLAAYADTLSNSHALIPNVPWEQERAMALSVFLQGVRSQAGDGDVRALQELRVNATKDDAYWDQLTAAARKSWNFIGGKVGAAWSLFFPCVGLAPLPLVGQPGLFQPTSPTTFIAALPVEIPSELASRQVCEWMDSGGMSAFSVGLDSTRVVVPPNMMLNGDRMQVRDTIVTARACATGLTKNIFKVNSAMGFSHFRVR